MNYNNQNFTINSYPVPCSIFRRKFQAKLSNRMDKPSPSTSADAPKMSRFTTSHIQQCLQPITAFAIVDPTEAPFMVVGEDGNFDCRVPILVVL